MVLPKHPTVGRTLIYITHVYYTVSPSLLEYPYPQGLMGVHTGASRNCGSQSSPSLHVHIAQWLSYYINAYRNTSYAL